MQFSFDIGAFVIAAIALGLTLWNMKRQSKLEEDQDRLNKLSIAREERDAEDRRKADDLARQAKIVATLTGNPRKYVVTFKNAGQHEATNLEMVAPPDSSAAALLQFALREAPKSLAPSEGRNFLAIVTMDMGTPFVFEVTYNDGRPTLQRQTITLDLP